MSAVTKRAADKMMRPPTAQNGALDGHVDFIQKPFTPDGIAEKVREVLGPNCPRETILLVDGDSASRTALRRYLTSDGYAVLEAASARQALDIAGQDRRLDLVIAAVREQLAVDRQQLPGGASAERAFICRPQQVPGLACALDRRAQQLQRAPLADHSRR